MSAIAVFSLAAAFLLSPDEPAPTPDRPIVVYPKKTVVDFSVVRVEGDVDGPGTITIYDLRRRLKRGNLMQMRTHFRDALERSAEGPSLVGP